MTIEEQYKIDHDNILRTTTKGSPGRQQQKQDLWVKFMADDYLRGGDDEILKHLQRKMILQISELQIQRYIDKTLTQTEYEKKGVEKTSLLYISELHRLGLATGVFDKTWVVEYARRFFDEETKLLKGIKKLTLEILEDKCEPLKTMTKEFIRKTHTDFGIKQLQDNPDIYDESFG